MGLGWVKKETRKGHERDIKEQERKKKGTRNEQESYKNMISTRIG